MWPRLAPYLPDGFLLGLVGALLLAWYLPGPGLEDAALDLARVADIGIVAIFLLYGLRLSLRDMAQGLANWRLHVAVQATTFLLFPLLTLAVRPLFGGGSAWWTGLFLLAALPSTVSSSVVMVGIARGNVPAAIFNASFSGLLGLVLTPLWMAPWVQGDGLSALLPLVGKLALQVLLPMVVGLLLHRWWGAFARTHQASLKRFDQAVILLIVYTSFSRSFASGLFHGLGWPLLAVLTGGLVLLFLVVMGVTGLAGRSWGFSRADRTTLQFCGSKKSLVHGSVMVKVLFAGSTAAGPLLLPIMIYHAAQLVMAGWMAQRLSKNGPPEDHPIVT